jgi:hypothetical protein
MTDKKWFEELLEAPTQVSLINEPIDYTVDFEVKETATERARRRWLITSDEELREPER